MYMFAQNALVNMSSGVNAAALHFTMFIERPVTQVMHVDLTKAFILCALDDGVIERRLQQFRASCDDINAHSIDN